MRRRKQKAPGTGHQTDAAPSPCERVVFAGMSPARTATLTLVLLLALAVGVLYRSAWSAGELETVPDSVEYAVAAQRFVTTGHYDIEINRVRYPVALSAGIPLAGSRANIHAATRRSR